MSHEHDHEHMDKDGSIYTHHHGHDDGHTHGNGHHHAHSPEETRAVLNRLSRAIGHLESVKQMVADGRDCSEVLIQLSAVRSALNKAGLVILQSHIEHCIFDAAREGDMAAIEDLNQAIERYLK